MSYRKQHGYGYLTKSCIPSILVPEGEHIFPDREDAALPERLEDDDLSMLVLAPTRVELASESLSLNITGLRMIH